MTLRGNRIATALAEYVAACARQPFDWPTANCCHFAAGWLAVATGRDPMAALPTTPDALAARRLVRKHGDDLRGVVSYALGRAPIVPALAQTGDLVLVDSGTEDGTGQALGLCSGPSIIALDAHGSAHFLPLEAGLCAWRLYDEEGA